MQVIYVDTMFMINLIINYLVLLASAKLCALQVKRFRLALSAALGGVYSVLTLFVPFCQQPVMKVTVGILMAMMAFGGRKNFLRITLVVFGVSAAFAGLIYGLTLMTGGDTSGSGYIFVSFRMLILSFGISYFVISFFFKRMARVSSETVDILVEYNDKSSRLTALKDTGHSLTDPITGRPVVIVGIETIRPLFEKSVLTALEKPATIALAELGEQGYSFRLIPYSAVGVENGMLLAFKPDCLRIDGNMVRDCLIAISPNQISDGEVYSALIGVDYY